MILLAPFSTDVAFCAVFFMTNGREEFTMEAFKFNLMAHLKKLKALACQENTNQGETTLTFSRRLLYVLPITILFR